MRSLCLALCAALICSPAAEARRRRRDHRERREPQTCLARCASRPLYSSRAPTPDVIDAELLTLCPAPSVESVDRAQVRAFLLRHLSDPRLQEAARDAAPFAKGDEARADWLTSIWAPSGKRRSAFTHVLCGDGWGRAKLGGLHLEARYVQLEREGKLCYGGPAKKRGPACKGSLCSIRFQGTQGYSCAAKRQGSFVQGVDAVGVLSAGTRAYAACCVAAPRRGRPRSGGRYRGPNGVTFQIWCERGREGARGLTTFYPIGFSRPTCG